MDAIVALRGRSCSQGPRVPPGPAGIVGVEHLGELRLGPCPGAVHRHHGQAAEVADDDHEPGPGSRGLRGDLGAAVVAGILDVPVGPAGTREGGIEPVHQVVELAPGLAVVVARGNSRCSGSSRDLKSSHSLSSPAVTRSIVAHPVTPDSACCSWLPAGLPRDVKGLLVVRRLSKPALLPGVRVSLSQGDGCL